MNTKQEEIRNVSENIVDAVIDDVHAAIERVIEEYIEAAYQSECDIDWDECSETEYEDNDGDQYSEMTYCDGDILESAMHKAINYILGLNGK